MYVLKLYIILCCSTFMMICGCKNNKHVKSNEYNYYSNKNYTDLKLDSTTINIFLKSSLITDSVRNDVNEFYSKRANQFAWFNNEGMVDATTVFYNQLKNYTDDFKDTTFNKIEIDSLLSLVQSDEKSFLSNIKIVNQLELLLTVTFFQYAHKVYGGTTSSLRDLEWYIPRKKKDYKMLLDSLVLASNGQTIQEPVSVFYTQLKDKLKQYRQIQKAGGLPAISSDKKLLKQGDTASCIKAIKQNLFLTGDLLINNKSIDFDDSLESSVKRFQRRMGLLISGRVDQLSIAEMNKSIDFRIQQIMVNMERLRWMPVKMETDYLLINIPEYKLHVYENGTTNWSMNVVVGKGATQTNIFKGNISEVVLNPYWNVPTSIVNNNVLPHLKRNVSFISKNNMEIRSGITVINPYAINWHKYKNAIPYTVRQKPGNNNSLGKIKFLFPNSFNIYLHDTPSKELFGETKRAFSHGCIRLEEPLKLACYISKDNTGWTNNRIDSVLTTDKETSISIQHRMPVYIVYFTAWVSSDGQMNFRNDIYNLDDKLRKEFFNE